LKQRKDKEKKIIKFNLRKTNYKRTENKQKQKINK
jgi:hypothetical protein